MRLPEGFELRDESGLAGRCIDEAEIGRAWRRAGQGRREQAAEVFAKRAGVSHLLLPHHAGCANEARFDAPSTEILSKAPTVEGHMLAVANGRHEIQAQAARAEAEIPFGGMKLGGEVGVDHGHLYNWFRFYKLAPV